MIVEWICKIVGWIHWTQINTAVAGSSYVCYVRSEADNEAV